MVMLMMGNGRFDFDIVGESHNQDGFRAVVGPKIPGGHDFDCIAALIQQIDNPYDSKAVAVCLAFDNGKVGHAGYLSRKNARAYCKAVDECGWPQDPQGMLCRAKIVGGWKEADGDEGYYGVKLDLVFPLKFGTMQAWDSWKIRLIPIPTA
jgi:hypothetical protein